jgi:hypothetical protein
MACIAHEDQARGFLDTGVAVTLDMMDGMVGSFRGIEICHDSLVPTTYLIVPCLDEAEL